MLITEYNRDEEMEALCEEAWENGLDMEVIEGLRE
jgi:hypothetical protein